MNKYDDELNIGFRLDKTNVYLIDLADKVSMCSNLLNKPIKRYSRNRQM